MVSVTNVKVISVVVVSDLRLGCRFLTDIYYIILKIEYNKINSLGNHNKI